MRELISAARPDLQQHQLKLFTAHTLRGGAAKAALNKGTGRNIVQQMLSHKNPTSTDIYTKATRNELRGAYGERLPGTGKAEEAIFVFKK